MAKTGMQTATLKKVVTTEVPVVRDEDLIYSLDVRGPATWRNLRAVDYGKNPETNTPFKMQTMPQAVRLANYGLTNRIQPVIKAVNNYWLTGDSLILWTPKGVYAVDNPSQDIVAQLNVDEQQVLKTIEQGLVSRLGKKEEKGVVFSDFGDVRYTPRDKIRFGDQTTGQLAESPGNIVLSGNAENAELNAKSAEIYRLNPVFYGVEDKSKLTLRVPALIGDYDFYGRLVVGADYFGDDVSWHSFGVQQTGGASAQKKA